MTRINVPTRPLTAVADAGQKPQNMFGWLHVVQGEEWAAERPTTSCIRLAAGGRCTAQRDVQKYPFHEVRKQQSFGPSRRYSLFGVTDCQISSCRDFYGQRVRHRGAILHICQSFESKMRPCVTTAHVKCLSFDSFSVRHRQRLRGFCCCRCQAPRTLQDQPRTNSVVRAFQIPLYLDI